jgi:hypothetical protein
MRCKRTIRSSAASVTKTRSTICFLPSPNVMPGLEPGIHAVPLRQSEAPMEWIAGSSPAMTVVVFGGA